MMLRRLVAIRLVSHDAAALSEFYHRYLGFTAQHESAIELTEMTLLGLAGAGRRTCLHLGGEALEIDQFDAAGAPYPHPRASNDPWFQHFAIRTPDIAAAWARALAGGATPISAAPVQLPAADGSVIAAKFRDPEGHPLEFLQFPELRAPGIDHSAISVMDAAASLTFYQPLGLTIGDRTRNHGPAQATLDALLDPQVDVVPLNPAGPGPHLELLAYRRPAAAAAIAVHANDIAATRLVWESDIEALIRDPDGHLHQCRTP